jgi:hypothetical protein
LEYYFPELKDEGDAVAYFGDRLIKLLDGTLDAWPLDSGSGDVPGVDVQVHRWRRGSNHQQ